MKKICFLCLFIIISTLMIAGCGEITPTDKWIYKKINTDISNCSIEVDSDNHGGFHGDGDYFVRAQCQDDFEEIVKNNSLWKKLPLTENLELIMYGGKKDNTEYGYELAIKKVIPKIEDGYYLFVDRHSESIDKNSDKELFNRYSFNFTIALFDNNTNIFYYYEFDT